MPTADFVVNTSKPFTDWARLFMTHPNEVGAAFARLEVLNLASARGWLSQMNRHWCLWSADLATILRELPFEISRSLGDRGADVVTALIGDGRHWVAMPEDEARRLAALFIFQLERTMQELNLQT